VSRGFCFDAGALIEIERGNDFVLALLKGAIARSRVVEVTAGVVAQTWRGGARQSRLAHFLRTDGVTVVDLDRDTAMAVGVLCGSVGSADVVDGHVALHALSGNLAVVTSDPDDISAFGGGIEIVAI